MSYITHLEKLVREMNKGDVASTMVNIKKSLASATTATDPPVVWPKKVGITERLVGYHLDNEDNVFQLKTE